MARGINPLCLCSAASRAGKGPFARRCAGRRGGHCAFVPGVLAFLDFRLTAAIHFPVFIGISLPIAQLAGVIIGVRLAVLEGCRACSSADARLAVHRLSRAGRIGHQIITTRILLIVDAGGYILLIAAETLMEVACTISLPRGRVAVFSFFALLPARALVPVFAVTCLPRGGIAVGGFATLLPARALVPVLAIICLPVAGIAVGGCVLRCVAVFALVIVVGFVTAPLRCVVDMVAHRKDFTIPTRNYAVRIVVLVCEFVFGRTDTLVIVTCRSNADTTFRGCIFRGHADLLCVGQFAREGNDVATR